jgi:hypothetical protein
MGDSGNIDKQKGKNRIEQVKDLSYRDLQISDNLRDSINNLIYRILAQINTLDKERLLYKVSGQNKIYKIKNDWDSIKDLRNDSYELWRVKNIDLTLITYPSSSKNTVTGKTEKIYVIEIEHHRLTGTCRMIFRDLNPTHINELTYTDRN